MVDEPPHSPAFDSATLPQLACPACYGELRLEQHAGSSRLLCLGCGRAYPMVDGIPVLIIDRATRPGREG